MKNKCRDCKWLTGRKTSVGIACEHPDRPFTVAASITAHLKYPSSPACKRFERREKDE